ncbi:methionine aminopeptidase [Lachnospiraceae bacterium]|nr:methionine aminopeptidase [Lachnospiraceae bacterium]
MEKIGRNDRCWCGSGKKYKTCHMAFDEKIHRYELEGHMVPQRGMLKSREQIQGIRESSVVNIAVLDAVDKIMAPGINTQMIDDVVCQVTASMGGIPAPLNYEGYPKSVCTSINQVVCHGIPSKDVVLQEGDIVNVDVSTLYKGYYSDSSRMYCIGKVSPEKEKLVRVARECMEKGIAMVKPWGFLGDMSQAVNDYAKQNGYSVVVDIGGHGIGLEFHEEPFVSYVAKAGTEMLLVPGFVFTIEPMVNMGTNEIYVDEEDNWTVYTADGKPSAQWEVTVAVTEEGCEVLTW